uniref:ribonuclease H n=1 Tax=Cacopsylla melanoneura TaxID=428564 RepID=A0A8D9AWA7_9HEMI
MAASSITPQKKNKIFYSIIKKKQNLPESFQMLEKPVNPIELINIDHNLTIEEGFRKEDVAPTVAKAKALEMIHTKYPIDQWTHIYTDGSMQNPDQGAGAGVTSELFSFYKGLGPLTTNFDGETEAIKIAVQQLLFRTDKFTKAVILTDCKAAIQAIISSEETPTNQTKEIRDIIKQLKCLKKQITLQWIPAHCGIHGNETADLLAKKGTEIVNSSLKNIPFHSMKRIIKYKYNQDHKEWIKKEANDKKWKDILTKPDIIPELPRKSAVASFRLLTGHDCLAEHLNRIGCRTTPTCPLCDLNKNMNAEHIAVCPNLIDNENITAKYWDARRKLTQIRQSQSIRKQHA